LKAKEEEAKKDTRVVIRTTFAITEEMTSRLEKMYPNHKIVCRKTNAPRHEHPYVAIERQITEQSILHRLSKHKVLDVYGNPGRHKSNKDDNVWSCIPLNEPTDDVAMFWAKNVEDAKYCNHQPIACDCIVCDSFMCLYRCQTWDMDDYLKLLHKTQKKTAFIAIRHFPDVFGKLSNDEIVYERDELKIHFTVAGDEMRYTIKDDSPWFTSSYYTDGRLAMAWQKVDRYGDTHIFVLTQSDPKRDTSNIQPTTHSLMSALVDPTVYGGLTYDLRGPVARDPYIKTSMERLELQHSKAFSLWNWVIFVTDKKRVVAPKGAVQAVRLLVAMRTRDEQLFASAAEKAKKELARFNIPPEMMADSVAAVTVLGFFADVQNEVGTMLPALQAFEQPIKRLATLLNFNPGFRTYPAWLTYGLASIAFVGVTYGASRLLITAIRTLQDNSSELARLRLQVSQTPRLNTPGPILKPIKIDPIDSIRLIKDVVLKPASFRLSHYLTAPLMVAKYYLPWLTNSVTYVFNLGTRVVRRFASFATRQSSSKVFYHEPVSRVDICMSDYPLPPMHHTAKVTEPLQVECRPKHGTTQFGAAFTVRVPVVARSCTCNEKVAVIARGCMDRPDPKDGAWADAELVFDSIFYVVEHEFVHMGRIKLPKFACWMVRFPPNRREELKRAKIELNNLDQPNSSTKAFVKREKLLKTNPEAREHIIPTVQLFAPRLIQGFHPRFQVVTGPVTYAMTKYCAYIWNHAATYGVDMEHSDKRRRTNYVYTSGMNAEQLGQSFEFHCVRLNNYGPIAFEEEDQSRFDAHCGKEAVRLILKPYEILRAKRKHLKALSALQHTKGVTAHGIVYEVEATVKSGAGNTSQGDTAIVVNGKEMARVGAKIPCEEIVTWNCGDDALTVLLRHHLKRYTNECREVWADLGFEAKVHSYTSAYDAEFCSGRFYPTNHGVVFGPKIGRILAKTFHSMNEYQNHVGKRWVRTVALGLHRDTHFVPILRVFIRKHLELTIGLKTIKIREEEKIHAMAYHEATPETFALLEHVYGYSATTIIQTEEWLDKAIISIPCTLSHPVLDDIIEQDCPEGDPPRRTEVNVNALASILSAMSKRDLKYLVGVGFALSNPLFISPTITCDMPLIRDCFVAPIAEEILKSQVPVFELLLPLAELALKFKNTMGVNLQEYPQLGYMYLIKDMGYYKVVLPSLLPAFLGHLCMIPIGRDAPSVVCRIGLHMYFNGLVYFASQAKPASIATIIKPVCLLSIGLTVLWSLGRKAWNKLMHSTNGNVDSVNYKGQLHELCVKWGIKQPSYQVTMSGQSHMPTFTARCMVTGKDGTIKGVNSSSGKSSTAEQQASKMMLEHMMAHRQDYTTQVVNQTDATNEEIIEDVKLALAYEFAYDRLYIDADNVRSPKNHPKLWAKETYFVGTSGAVVPWEAYLDNWTQYFGDISEKIVEAKPDAADLYITQHIMHADKSLGILLVTKDVKFSKAASAAHPGVVVYASIEEAFPVNLVKAAKVLSKNLITSVSKLYSRPIQVDPGPAPVTKPLFKSF